MKLEQRIKLLEKQKASLEQQIKTSNNKAIIFDKMIDIAEKECNIPIKKNLTRQSLHTETPTK